jgi:hypothetical protein
VVEWGAVLETVFFALAPDTVMLHILAGIKQLCYTPPFPAHIWVWNSSFFWWIKTPPGMVSGTGGNLGRIIAYYSH